MKKGAESLPSATGLSKRIGTAIVVGILVMGLTGLNVLSSIQAVALDLGFYMAKWVELNIPRSAGMSLDDLEQAARKLLDYFTRKQTTAQLIVSIDKTQRLLYRENEIAHLEDVRDLFQLGLCAKRVCQGVVFLGAILTILISIRKPGDTKSHRAKETANHPGLTAGLLAAKSLKIAGIILAAITVLLALPAAFDFTGWWTNFHLLTFENDLWRLDPENDWLIKIFPEEFFFSAAKRAALYSAAITLSYIAVGIALGLFVSYFSSNHGKHYL
ncbi:MAG TPA: DUF1461 domain-containing protein [Firmicutes bacterium]|nr:DUF1461 domain-containing protein [Candidatus Fermentithermobacillaceae bacterium]